RVGDERRRLYSTRNLWLLDHGRENSQAGRIESFGVNFRYCLTGVFHAQVVMESEFMHRRAVALLPTAAIVGISVSASAADAPRKAPISTSILGTDRRYRWARRSLAPAKADGQHRARRCEL